MRGSIMSPSAFIACKKVLSLVWYDQADRCGVFTDSPAGSGVVVMGAIRRSYLTGAVLDCVRFKLVMWLTGLWREMRKFNWGARGVWCICIDKASFEWTPLRVFGVGCLAARCQCFISDPYSHPLGLKTFLTSDLSFFKWTRPSVLLHWIQFTTY